MIPSSSRLGQSRNGKWEKRQCSWRFHGLVGPSSPPEVRTDLERLHQSPAAAATTEPQPPWGSWPRPWLSWLYSYMYTKSRCREPCPWHIILDGSFEFCPRWTLHPIFLHSNLDQASVCFLRLQLGPCRFYFCFLARVSGRSAQSCSNQGPPRAHCKVSSSHQPVWAASRAFAPPPPRLSISCRTQPRDRTRAVKRRDNASSRRTRSAGGAARCQPLPRPMAD